MRDTRSADDDERSATSTRRSVLRGIGLGTTAAILGASGGAAAQGGQGNGTTRRGGGNRPAGTGGDTYVRAAHVATGAPPVTALVDGETVFDGVEFGNVTEYAPLDPGIHQFRVTPTGMSDTTIFEARAALGPGAFTAAAVGSVSGDELPVPMLLQDGIGPLRELPQQAQGRAEGLDKQAHVRFVHVAEGVDPVTITTGGGVTLAEDVQFAQSTGYVGVQPDGRSLRIYPAGDTSGDPVATVTATFDRGNVYTAFLAPDDPVDLVLAQDAVRDGGS
ncbi:MAG: DUF4397 domain-containing protein [Salinigranum sp.]